MIPSNPDVQLETATSVTIVRLGYRARCSEAGCRNLGRMILRHADVGGAPMTSREFCLAHGRTRVERDRSAGLRVYDDREGAVPVAPVAKKETSL